MWIENVSWDNVQKGIEDGRVVVVPVGAAAKEHGQHLPLGTDKLIAKYYCERVSKKFPILIAPMVQFGYYPAFQKYPGSQSISFEVFHALLHEICMQIISWKPRGVVILNTGVSTTPAVTMVSRQIFDSNGFEILVANLERLLSGKFKLFNDDGSHADAMETSMVMDIDESLVRLERAAPEMSETLRMGVPLLQRPLFMQPFDASDYSYNATGSIGDPTKATKELGKIVNEHVIEKFVEALMEEYGK